MAWRQWVLGVLLLLPISGFAAPITYTLSTIGSGCYNGSCFTDQSITITGVGDTSQVVDVSGTLPPTLGSQNAFPSGSYGNDLSAGQNNYYTSILVNGFSPFILNDSKIYSTPYLGSTYIEWYDVGETVGTYGSFTPTESGFAVFGSPSLTGYDLTGSDGPIVSSDIYLQTGVNSPTVADWVFYDDYGNSFWFTSNQNSATFTASEAAGIPEPSSAFILIAGLFSGIIARRRISTPD